MVLSSSSHWNILLLVVLLSSGIVRKCSSTGIAGGAFVSNESSASLSATFIFHPDVVGDDSHNNHHHHHNNDNNAVGEAVKPILRLLPCAAEENPSTTIERIDIVGLHPPHQAYLVRSTDIFSVVAPPPPPPPSSYNHNKTQHHQNQQQQEQSRRQHALQRTAYQARVGHCNVGAANGGPFHADGTSVGAYIVNGTVHQGQDFGGAAVGFGWTMMTTTTTTTSTTTTAKRCQWVVGTIESVAHAQRLRMQDFVTGFDWLVEEGRNVAAHRKDTTGAHRAPRTSVGVDAQGRFVILVADGCEKCFRNQGLTLVELADALIQQANVTHAINLDGGSSSTLVYDQKVVNRPTCLDVAPLVCQRPVATVLCIRSRNV